MDFIPKHIFCLAYFISFGYQFATPLFLFWAPLWSVSLFSISGMSVETCLENWVSWILYALPKMRLSIVHYWTYHIQQISFDHEWMRDFSYHSATDEVKLNPHSVKSNLTLFHSLSIKWQVSTNFGLLGKALQYLIFWHIESKENKHQKKKRENNGIDKSRTTFPYSSLTINLITPCVVYDCTSPSVHCSPC